MKVKDIPGFQKFLREIIEQYPIYNRPAYFNKLYGMYNSRQKDVKSFWGIK